MADDMTNDGRADKAGTAGDEEFHSLSLY
jgi:hypothetical protein